VRKILKGFSGVFVQIMREAGVPEGVVVSFELLWSFQGKASFFIRLSINFSPL
jgi:hypothetical protein